MNVMEEIFEIIIEAV